MDIGATVKQLRKEKGYTLREFAEKCKLSPSLVSQVERNAASPSIQTLIKMGEVLGVPVGTFFEEGKKEEGIIVRKQQRRKLQLPHHIPVYELITPSELDGEVRLVHVQLESEQYSSPEKITHHDKEICYVQAGQVRVIFPDHVYDLETGDCISFHSTTPHHFYNAGSNRAALLLVIFKA